MLLETLRMGSMTTIPVVPALAAMMLLLLVVGLELPIIAMPSPTLPCHHQQRNEEELRLTSQALHCKNGGE